MPPISSRDSQHQASTTPKLTAKNRSAIDLLARLYFINRILKEYPTKYRLSNSSSASTRASRGQVIDHLMGLGLIENMADTPNAPPPSRANPYRLKLTDLGEKEVQHWATHYAQQVDKFARERGKNNG